ACRVVVSAWSRRMLGCGLTQPSLSVLREAMTRSRRPQTGTDAAHVAATRRALLAAVLTGIAIVSLVFHLWGIRRDLPYVMEPDEAAVVEPAVRIASTGDWHPTSFLYPASTVIYPLAVIYRLQNGFAHGGAGLRADPDLAHRFEREPGEFYLLARLLSVAYAVAALPVTFLLGRIAFDTPVGLLAAWLVVLSPLAVGHAQIARTDSAGMFFTVLTLWL